MLLTEASELHGVRGRTNSMLQRAKEKLHLFLQSCSLEKSTTSVCDGPTQLKVQRHLQYELRQRTTSAKEAIL